MKNLRIWPLGIFSLLAATSFLVGACGDDSEDTGSGSGSQKGGEPGAACNEAGDCGEASCRCADGLEVSTRSCTDNRCDSPEAACSANNASLANLCASHGGLSGGGGPQCATFQDCSEQQCFCADGTGVGTQLCLNGACASPADACSSQNASFVDVCSSHGGF